MNSRILRGCSTCSAIVPLFLKQMEHKTSDKIGLWVTLFHRSTIFPIYAYFFSKFILLFFSHNRVKIMEHLKILTKIITFLTGFKAVPHRLNLMEHKNEQIPKSRALARSTIDLKSWNKVEQIKNESKQYKNSKKQFFKSEKKEFRSMQFAVIKYWARLVRFAAGIFIDTAKKWTGAVDNLVSANGYFNLVFISAVSRIDKLATTAKGFGRKILFPLGFSVGEYSLYGVCIARDTTKGKSGYFDTEYIFYYSPIHIWIIPNFKELQ